MKKLSLLAIILIALNAPAAEHVVLIVWDGLRPDSVNDTNTPTLAKLAREGVFFANHHAVYISSTEGNGVTLATGAYPGRTGIIANREFRPELNPLKPVTIESPETIQKADALTHGHYLGLETLPEIVRAAGIKTAVAGSKPIARLFDRTGNCFVNSAKPNLPNTKADLETTRHLTGPLWDNGVPQLSLLWLSEPDLSQHEAGLGSPKALAALNGSDQALAHVLEELKAKGVRDKTDVLIVSDHGFSTVARTVNVVTVLTNAGFKAYREFKQPPQPGELMVVGLSGSVMLYVTEHDPRLTRQLVEFLQRQDFTGAIFTRDALSGTFGLEKVRIATKHSPDIIVSMRWSEEKNGSGSRGLLVADAGRAVGQGTHASLSRYDMHNTLIAAGPHFRRGMTNVLPSGNADVTPTILSILGVKPKQLLDGRILGEALVAGQLRKVPVVLETLEASCDLGSAKWQQYLKVTTYAGATYFDEGNGSSQVIHSEEKSVSP